MVLACICSLAECILYMCLLFVVPGSELRARQVLVNTELQPQLYYFIALTNSFPREMNIEVLDCNLEYIYFQYCFLFFFFLIRISSFCYLLFTF